MKAKVEVFKSDGSVLRWAVPDELADQVMVLVSRFVAAGMDKPPRRRGSGKGVPRKTPMTREKFATALRLRDEGTPIDTIAREIQIPPRTLRRDLDSYDDNPDAFAIGELDAGE